MIGDKLDLSEQHILASSFLDPTNIPCIKDAPLNPKGHFLYHRGGVYGDQSQDKALLLQPGAQ